MKRIANIVAKPADLTAILNPSDHQNAPILIGVVLGEMPLLSKRSAAFRHSVLVATVACALTLPLLGATVPSWSLGLGPHLWPPPRW